EALEGFSDALDRPEISTEREDIELVLRVAMSKDLLRIAFHVEQFGLPFEVPGRRPISLLQAQDGLDGERGAPMTWVRLDAFHEHGSVRETEPHFGDTEPVDERVAD